MPPVGGGPCVRYVQVCGLPSRSHVVYDYDADSVVG